MTLLYQSFKYSLRVLMILAICKAKDLKVVLVLIAACSCVITANVSKHHVCACEND